MHELYDPKHDYNVHPAGTPHLVYGGGPLLAHAEVFGVFIDNGSGYPFVNEMRAFQQWLLGSDAVGLLAEYNVGLGSYKGDTILKWGGTAPPPPPPPPPGGNCDALLNAWLTCMFGFSVPKITAKKAKHKSGSPDLPHRKRVASQVVTDTQIEKFISDNIASGVLPHPNSNGMTLYTTFWPSGMVIQYDAQNSSCQQFCGYHSSFDMNGVPVRYAVLPYPDCAGCTGGMTVLNALTTVTTHEIRESMTDAGADGSGWYDQANGEADDICAWKERVDAGYTVQLEWSNKGNKCI